MTVLSQVSSVSYATDGVSRGPFVVPFYFLDAGDLVVQAVVGTLVTLVLNTDYTVAGAGDPNGGSITTTNALATGTLTIYRDPTLTQVAAFPDHGRFPAASHERALDRLTMIAQRLAQRIDDVLADISSVVGATEYAATGAPTVRKASDRANDFVRLDDYVPIGVGMGRKDALASGAARSALLMKGGGRLLLGYGIVDLGSGSYNELGNAGRIMYTGEDNTIIQSTATSGPVWSFGNGTVQANLVGLENARIYCNNPTPRTGPALLAQQGWELHLNEVAVHFNAADGDIAFQIDGGSLTYNNRLVGPKVYGVCNVCLVVGKAGGRVPGFYLTGGFSFSRCKDAGILLINVDGCIIQHGEVILAGMASDGVTVVSRANALRAAPGPGQTVTTVQMGDVQFDTSSQQGVLLADTGGIIGNWMVDRMWCATNGRLSTSLGNLNTDGMRLVGSTAPTAWAADKGAKISNVIVSNSIIGNNGGNGVVTLNSDNIHFVNCYASGNGSVVPGFGYFIGNGSRHVHVSGGAARGKLISSVDPLQLFAAAVDTDTDYISFVNRVDMTGNVSGAFASNTSTGANNSIVSGPGYYS